MFRFVGSVYMSGIERLFDSVNKVLADRSHNYLIANDNEIMAQRFRKNSESDVKYCATKALSAYDRACNAYLKEFGRYSPLYLKSLIDCAIAAYYSSDEAVCVKAIELFAANVKLMLGKELERLNIGQREEFWKEWLPYFTNIIPWFAYKIGSNDKLNGIAYNCALIYKGLMQNYNKDGFLHSDNWDITWKDVQKKLKACDMALEIIRSKHFERGNHLYFGIYITSQDKSPHIEPFVFEEDLESTALKDRFYNTTDLYKVVWNSLSPAIETAKRIYFSPDGSFYKIGLEYVPYDGLQYVDEKWEINRLSSTRELLDEDKYNNTSSALLVGGLSYEGHTSNLRNSVYDIPESLIEVEAIAKMFDDANIQYTLFSSDNGNEEMIRTIKKYPSIVHFATHGYNWNNNQLKVRKGMNFVSELENFGLDMLGSGLYLSGVNKLLQGDNTRDYKSDGILSAAEVSQMDFSDTRLVVLSACESGLGRIDYDGVMGLQRGFKQAGAKTLLMSLWKVDDKATSLFMQEFYRSLFAGHTAQQAMINARNYLRSYEEKSDMNSIVRLYPYRDPKYWAAFVLLDGVNTRL